jgi:hypothetical protein
MFDLLDKLSINELDQQQIERKILPTTGRCTFSYLQPFNHASRFVLAH